MVAKAHGSFAALSDIPRWVNHMVGLLKQVVNEAAGEKILEA